MTATFSLSARLLGAVAKWSSADPSREHIGVVAFKEGCVVATDGHRLVQLDQVECHILSEPEDFGIRRRHAFMLADLAKSLGEDQLHFTIPTIGKKRDAVHIPIVVALSDVKVNVKAEHVDRFPPTSGVFPTVDKGEPPVIAFDPKFLAAMNEICAALLAPGVRISRWSRPAKFGDSDRITPGPMQFDVARYAKMVIMPRVDPDGTYPD